MGNNAAYRSFEATVVGAYRLGKLDKDLLKVLMEPYRNMDIDSGGKAGLTGEDGLEVEEIVIKVWGGKVPDRPKLPKDYMKWTPAQDQENEAYYDALGNAFNKITDKFGWA